MHMGRKTTVISAAMFMVLAGLGACSPKSADDSDATNAVTPPSVATETDTANAGDIEVISGSPALWTATDEDTTVYLFGTVHILKPGTQWRTPEFDAAFASADAIYFEADTTSPEAEQAVGPLIMQYGLYTDGRTLRDVLDDADEKEVEEAAALLGLPMSALDPMKPWTASINLTFTQLMQDGFDPESGVEIVLEADAAAAGKPLRYFETMEQQLMFFAGMDEEDQIASLVATAEMLEDSPDMIDDLITDWQEADIDGIAELMSDVDVLGSEAIYQTLIVNRNADWVEQIEALMQDEAGTFFIAVGAGHLAGEDSVIAQLRADGIDVSGP